MKKNTDYKNTLNKTIGNNIRLMREYRHMECEYVAKETSYSLGHIQNIESGTCGISIDLLSKLCVLFNCSSDSLIKGHTKYTDFTINEELMEVFRNCPDEEIRFLINSLKDLKKNYELSKK